MTTSSVPDYTVDHVERLAAESKETTRQLEERVFRIIEQVEPEVKGKYFISTADFSASVNYAPLFNLSRAVLERIAPDPTHTLLREIRDNFLVHIGPSGFIREVGRSIRDNNVHVGDMLFIEVGSGGEIGELICFSPGGTRVEVSRPVKDTVQSWERVGRVLQSLLSKLREALEGDDVYKCYLIIRPEEHFENTARNKLDIMQIGVVFIPQDVAIDDTVLTYFRTAQISSFATLAHLYEKERYYEKAVRQAIKGSIIKYGDRHDIASQADILRGLQERHKWNVPAVEKLDPFIRNIREEFSWYKMSSITLPMLMDIFAFTKGFEDYEVAALIRSCFMHLRDTYWGEDLKPGRYRPLPFLIAPLYLAISTAEGAILTVSSQASEIEQGNPVKLSRGIDVFSATDIKKYWNVIRNMRGENQLKVSINWAGESKGNFIIDNPIKTLQELQGALRSRVERQEISRLTIHEKGRLHGDAHFGNLLVDSSVPEDPLIFSIDPKPYIFNDSVLSGELSTDADLKRELRQIEDDISYDVARFMLSTSCFYGLVYRSGFILNPSQEDDEGSEILLDKNDSEEPVKLSDTGGVSSSQIVRMGAIIPVDTWRYHAIASNKAINEFIAIHHEYPAEFGSGFQRSVNISLIRLWIITVRHAFSAVKSLFPIKMENAMVMYLLAAMFVNRGAEVIKEMVDKDLDNPDTEQILKGLFLWD
jgi:hypothetical protein